MVSCATIEGCTILVHEIAEYVRLEGPEVISKYVFIAHIVLPVAILQGVTNFVCSLIFRRSVEKISAHLIFWDGEQIEATSRVLPLLLEKEVLRSIEIVLQGFDDYTDAQRGIFLREVAKHVLLSTVKSYPNLQDFTLKSHPEDEKFVGGSPVAIFLRGNEIDEFKACSKCLYLNLPPVYAKDNVPSVQPPCKIIEAQFLDTRVQESCIWTDLRHILLSSVKHSLKKVTVSVESRGWSMGKTMDVATLLRVQVNYTLKYQILYL